MNRILSIVMLAGLIAVTAHAAGPLSVDHGRVFPLSSIDGVGSLEIELTIRFVPERAADTRVVVIDDDGNDFTARPPSASERAVINRSGRTPTDALHQGIAVVRAFRRAAIAIVDFVLTHTAGR